MSLLECPIPESEWAREAGAHNGVPVTRAATPARTRLADAGTWQTTVQKLAELQHLGNDWDGLGAVAPSRELLESAIALAYLLHEHEVEPPQGVVPGMDGSVNLEWQNPDGTLAEVEIDRPFHAEVMVIEPGKPPRFWALPTD